MESYSPKDAKPYLRTLCLKILLGLLSRRGSAPKIMHDWPIAGGPPSPFSCCRNEYAGCFFLFYHWNKSNSQTHGICTLFQRSPNPGPRPVWNRAAQAMGERAREAPLTRGGGLCSYVKLHLHERSCGHKCTCHSHGTIPSPPPHARPPSCSILPIGEMPLPPPMYGRFFNVGSKG